jgi:hypothetical protein
VDTAGDSVLAVFESPVEALECSVEIQKELTRRNRQLAELFPNLSHDLLWSRGDLDRHCLFGLFQIGELARQDLFRGVMSLARVQTLAKKIVRSFQINEIHA